jgi:DNA-binding transcriptional LysR family regulator
VLRRSSDSQWWPRVSVGTKILPRLLGTFRAEWPGIRIGLRESRDNTELIHAVETGDIDVTFIDIGPYETGPLEVRPLLDDPMMFLAPRLLPRPDSGRSASPTSLTSR